MSNPNGKTWNERLVYAMKKRGINQTTLAKLAKVSNPTVHAWMNDQEGLHANNKAKLDDLLKLPARYLIEGACTLEDTQVVGASVQIPYNIKGSEKPKIDSILDDLSDDQALEFSKRLAERLAPKYRARLLSHLAESLAETQ